MIYICSIKKKLLFFCRNIPVIRRKFSDVSRGGSLDESQRLFMWVKLSFTFTMTITLALYGQFKRIVSLVRNYFISNVSLCTKHFKFCDCGSSCFQEVSLTCFLFDSFDTLQRRTGSGGSVLPQWLHATALHTTGRTSCVFLGICFVWGKLKRAKLIYVVIQCNDHQ